MAVTWNINRYGEAELTIQSLTGTRTVTITHPAGTTFPNAHTVDVSTVFNVAESTTGISPPTGVWGVAIVEDDFDQAGDYSSGTRLMDYKALGSGGSLPATISCSTNRGGTYRIVITVGDSAANALDTNDVTTGGTSAEYHHDSDGAANSSAGGLNGITVTGNRVAGVGGLLVSVESNSSTSGNWKYGQVVSQSIEIQPVPASTDLMSELKTISMAFSVNQGSGTYIKSYSATPTAGSITNSSINIDTDWGTASGGTNHYVHLFTDGTVGASGWQADVYGIGTAEGTTAAQRMFYVLLDTDSASESWYYGENNLTYFTTPKLASARIELKSDSGGATNGANSYSNSGYTNVNKLFRRPQPSGLSTYAVPYLEAWVFDAYGNALVSKNITMQVRRHTDSSNENSQNLATDANGRIRWNYTISRTHIAFNRYKKPVETVDDPASPPMSVAEVDTSGADPYAFVTGNTDFRGPYPAYPKNVRVLGRVFGSKEPSDEETSVFGLNSETHVPSSWTGDLSQASVGADNAPDGQGRRNKNLGTGALRHKLSSEYDEGNGVVIDLTRPVPRDAAGRTFDVSIGSNEYITSTAIYNDTLESVTQAKLDGNNQFSLADDLGYSNQFNSIPAPTDPSVLRYFVAFADSTTMRSAWSITTGENVGYSGSDTGNYGHHAQSVQFIAVDPDLNFYVTADKISTFPGDQVTISARMIRLLPSQESVGVTPDEPLFIKVLEKDGATTEIVSEPMVDSGDGVNFSYSFQLEDVPSAYSILITGFKDGSRPPDSGDLAISGTGRNEDYVVIVNSGSIDAIPGNWSPGEGYATAITIINKDNDQIVMVDETVPGTPDATVILTRTGGASGQEFLHTDNVWYPIVDIGQPGNPTSLTEFQMSENNKRYFVVWSSGTGYDTSGWSDNQDMSVAISFKVDGVRYDASQTEEIIRNYISLSLSAGNLSSPGTHVTAGDTITIGSALENRESKIDFDSAKVTIRRFNSGLGTTEYLDAALEWQTGDDFYYFTMSASPGDSKIAIYSLDTSLLTDFGNEDLLIRVEMVRDGVSYAQNTSVTVVHGKNRHDKNDFDPVSFATGFPFK